MTQRAIITGITGQDRYPSQVLRNWSQKAEIVAFDKDEATKEPYTKVDLLWLAPWKIHLMLTKLELRSNATTTSLNSPFSPFVLGKHIKTTS